MRAILISALDVARKFIGVKEVAGSLSNPLILAMLQLDNKWPKDDEVAWCSAFGSFVCWLLGLPRSKSLMARSWLLIGIEIELKDAEPGMDIVILKRGENQPDATVINAPGHMGFYASHDQYNVDLVSGNSSNMVRESGYPLSDILSVRRLI